MDLAKIRQKARQGLHNEPLADSPQIQLPRDMSAAVNQKLDDAMPLFAQSIGDDLFSNTEVSVCESPAKPHQHSRRKNSFNPIDIIHAGREAAGCNEDLQISTAEQSQTIVEDYEEFLCIRVSNEVYGINIMHIKEIIKPREVTEIPRAPSFVSGIISLRGVIIPIVDMLDRLGLAREALTSKGRVVVVKHGEEFTGLLVDEVIQVVRIAKDRFEPVPAVLEGINRDFVTGIGRTSSRMIILLNLDTITDINLY